MTQPEPRTASPETVSAILRSTDTGPDALYPAAIGVFCDACGRVEERDYLVNDRTTRAERFEIARSHLRVDGWRCDDDGDLCPGCAAPAGAAHTCAPFGRTTEVDCPACQTAERALARGETHL